MNTGEKIDYMIQCLQVAKAECEYLDEWNAKDWEDGRMTILRKHSLLIRTASYTNKLETV